MSTPGEINSNFYQIVDVDIDGNPTQVKPQYININTVANSNYANFAGTAYDVSVSNVSGIGNIATVNLDGNSGNYLDGTGSWGPVFATNANYANYAGNAFSVAGANVTGYVPNATHATVANTANAVSVANVVGIGNIATINKDGNSSHVLYGNGVWANIPTVTNVANANYANFAGTAYNVSGSNVSGYVNDANHATVANTANSVAGANVTGVVANANYASYSGNAFSVDVANVVGIGNIATINIDNNSSNILYGNGVFAAFTAPPAANANYANYAGNAFSVDVANVVGIGNIATINLDGNVSNLLAGDGTWVALPSTANANYANYAGQVVDATQSNITSLGTLIDLTVSGNITSGNANLGNLAVANFFSGDGGLLSNITAANVVGNLPVRFDVKNTSGGTLNKGTPIYITGSVGVSGVVEVSASRADTAGTMGCVGILEQTLNNNDFGTAISVGTLSSINTNSYVIGQQLYVAPTGGLTNVRPVDGYIVQTVGVVSRVNASTGSLEVNIWNYNGLPNLDNGNIWVGNAANGYPAQAVLSTATVGNANYANYAGHVTNNTQPNITSLGILSSLTVTGLITATGTGVKAGNIEDPSGTVTIVTGYGSVVGDVGIYGTLTVGTSGTGNITAYNANLGNVVTANYTNAVLTTGSQPNITSTGTLTSLNVTGNISSGNANLGNLVTANYFSGNGSLLTGIVASNATAANTILANTAGSLFTNLPILFANGNSYANGYYSPLFSSGLTFSRFGTLNTFSVTGAMSVSGNLSSGNATLGNLATSNYFSGNGSLLTSLTGGNVTGTVSSATTAGTVTTAAQPNITSTGTLVSLTVTGNTTTGNISSVGLGNVANVLFTKYNETVVAGGSTGAATITPNAAAGTIYNYTLTGNITLSSLTNAVAGTSMVIILTQDATGGRTLTSTMKFAGASKTLSTAANAIDIMSVFYDGSTYYATLSKGYA